MGEVRLFLQSLKDFATKPMLRLALLPFLIVGGVMLAGFFVMADAGLDQMQESTLHIQKNEVHVDASGTLHTDELNATYRGSGLVDYLLSNPWTAGVMSFLVYTVGALMTAMVSIYAALVVIGFLTPLIIRRLRAHRYPDITLEGDGSPLASMWLLFKTTLVALGLFILLIPLYFIPGINLVAFNLPFYYLFHKQLTGEISSEMMSRRDALVIRDAAKNRLRFRTLVLYLLSLLPLVWLVIPVFYVIYLANGYFEALAAYREDNRQKGGADE